MSEIQLYTGIFFNFENLESNDISILDIAHSLSNQCRWSGHTIFHYSVAQHSCYCHDLSLKIYNDYKLSIECLLHDAPEAVIIDLPRPLKKMLPEYVKLVNNIELWMAKKFDYTHPMPKEVKLIDDGMLLTEYQQIVDKFVRKFHPDFNDFYVEPFDININKWSTKKAEKEFLDRYYGWRK